MRSSERRSFYKYPTCPELFTLFLPENNGDGGIINIRIVNNMKIGFMFHLKMWFLIILF